MTSRTKIAFVAAGAAAGVVARNVYLRSRERSISGDVVLITGGSRGLGLALAQKFFREGCRVAVCARDRDELERARQSFGRRGSELMTVVCDVTKRPDVERMITDVTRRFGRIDILVNNAGIIQVGPVEATSIADYEEAMNVMFWGMVHPTLTLLPAMLGRKKGNIVNITSIGAKVSVPHLLPYSAAKHAAEGFSEGLRSELKGSGVAVTTIAPGLMRTGSYNAALFKGRQAAEEKWFSASASAPGLTIGARKAASQIVSAMRRGESQKILTTPATILARVHGLFPGLTQDLLGAVGKLVLPGPGGDKKEKPGWSLGDLKSPQMKLLLTLGREAAKRFNQRLA